MGCFGCFSSGKKEKRVRLPPGDPSKRALIVGCNYFGSKCQLRGCIRDAETMANLLVTRYRFMPKHVIVLRDDSRDPRFQPTRANILAWIRWLTSNLTPGSSLVFHFSGHGVRIRDKTGDERDGYCSALLPCDHARSGGLLDKDLNRLLVNPIPKGVQLFSVVDACHSGTVLDLPYKCKKRRGGLKWRDTYEAQPKAWKGTRGGRAVQISAAADVQKAIDTSQFTGAAQGAATYAFTQALLRSRGQITWGALLAEMHHVLEPNDSYGLRPTSGKFGSVVNSVLNVAGVQGQTPMMCCNEKLDLNQPFWL